jgi:YYY domain-containing protein
MEYGLVVLWLAMYLVVGLAALPLAAALFPRFRDAGAAFAVPVGLATVGIVGYLVGHVAFGWPALLVALATLVLASAAVGDREAVDEYAYAEAAAVFAVAFCFLVAVRSVSPAVAPLPLATGEKFLDFGLVRTTLRAGSLPPEDMWFAGETVQYYYGGHVLTALLATFTGTAPRFAYNLALAGFYAALVTAAYGLAGAVAADHGAPTRVAAGLGAFFVGVAGNLHTAGQVLAWLLPNSLITAVPGVAGESEALSWSPAEFSYWPASRVIDGTINEFPLFAWLNGDLHAHMMSTPFLLVVAALCLSYWQTPAGERIRRLLLLAAVAPVVGLLAIVSTWDVPTAAGLVALTVAFAPADPATLLPSSTADRLPEREGLAGELRRDGLALVAAIVVLVAGSAVVLPFWLGSATARGIGFLPEQRSGMGGLLLVHGGFLLLFVAYLAGRAREHVPVERPPRAVAWGVIAAAFGVAVWLAGFAALVLFGPLVAAAWLALRGRTDVGFEALLMLAGFGLVLLVEFVFVVDPGAPERLNTVFKVYMQVWVLWSPAAGVALARLVDPSNALPSVDTPEWRAAGTALGVAVLLTTGLYAGFAVPAHFENEPVGADGQTLDGRAYTYAMYPDESAAIDWLETETAGSQPTIVTAAPGGYWWDYDRVDEDSFDKGASAPSSLTGVPTVLGWFHEAQYRGEEPFRQRRSDVATIYDGSPEAQSALFDRYDVEYVYVGPIERNAYDLTVEDHPNLEVAFEQGEVVIYEVQD